MIIELLYSKFKSKTFWRVVFLYFIEFVIIHQMIWLTEVIHEKKADHYGDEDDSMTDFAKSTDEALLYWVRPFLTLANAIIVFIHFHR